MSRRLTKGLLTCCVGFGLLASCGDEETPPSGASGEAGAQLVEAGAAQGGAGATSSMDEAGRGGQRSPTESGAAGELSELPAGAGGMPGTSAGSPNAGGQAGSGAEAGSGEGGSGPDDGFFGDTRLGARCNKTEQCADPRAPGLFCLAPTDTSFGAAPPSGLCTANCQNDLDCDALGWGALCMDIFGSGTGHCVEGCYPGAIEGVPKCHERDELACTPLDVGDTQTPCLDESDCVYNGLCSSGTCHLIIAACLPACQGDNDCAPGLHCDQQFYGGSCVEAEQVGKQVGEPCVVSDEPDECLGFCMEDAPGSSTGSCTQTCSYDYPCAFDTALQRYEGSCMYTSALIRDTARGDFGYCAPACSCTEQCGDPALVCLDRHLNTNVYSGQGLCSEDGTQILDQCGAGGAGGSGG